MMPAMNSPQSQNTRVIRWSARLALAVIILGPLAPAWAEQYSGGSGSSSDPYLIGTAADLDLIGQTPTDWDKHFRMTADIDLTGYNEKNFHLIGTWIMYGDLANKPFVGVFDGDGRTISNFQYKDKTQNGVGLFRYVDLGDIKNLRLKNVKIFTDGQDVGALVGRFDNGAIINCHVLDADVTGNTRVGALVGGAGGMMSQCSSRGRVAGITYVGGLAGCVTQGTVKASYSKAAVSGSDSVGGITGATLNEAALVSACYATGKVIGGASAGGLIGQVVAGRVFWSYATGAVTGSQYVGGLVGNMKVRGEVILSYWDSQTSGRTTSAGGSSRTTAQMWSGDTYVNWDFGETWSICDGRSYPIFLWQIPSSDLRCPDGVTAADFAWFAMQWNRSDCGAVNSDCEWADFDGSGAVGFSDLAILAEEWLEGTY